MYYISRHGRRFTQKTRNLFPCPPSSSLTYVISSTCHWGAICVLTVFGIILAVLFGKRLFKSGASWKQIQLFIYWRWWCNASLFSVVWFHMLHVRLQIIENLYLRETIYLNSISYSINSTPFNWRMLNDCFLCMEVIYGYVLLGFISFKIISHRQTSWLTKLWDLFIKWHDKISPLTNCRYIFIYNNWIHSSMLYFIIQLIQL